MASKRKSTTPCMIPLKTLALDPSTGDELNGKSEKQDVPDLTQSTDLNKGEPEVQSNGHQNVNGDHFFCKYCNFGSKDTKTFIDHMETKHVGFKEDPSYVCIACSYLVKDPKELETHNAELHSGESNLAWNVAKHESGSVVEQSLSDHHADQIMPGHLPEQRGEEVTEIAITKTPIMKIMKSKPETKRILTIKDVHEAEKKSQLLCSNGILPVSKANITSSNPIVNGSVIGTILPGGVTQLIPINSQPMLQSKLPTIIAPAPAKPSVVSKSQQPPTAKNLPKVMIPLSSIPTYNVSMDSNCFLKNSFNKFPYPTKAELCYLTVVTKYPEEQIKIWFTAQRLKQGISWTPEEIEDSRKKMFNTVIQSIPQPVTQPTITVLNAPIVAKANNVQHLIHATLPGQIVSQPQGASGLLVTQPIIPNGIQGANASVSLTVAPFQTITQTMSSSSSPASVVGSTRSVTPTSPSLANLYDAACNRSKKSRHQLNALKNSFHKSQFPSPGEVSRLTKITGLNTRDVRKWFSDKRYHWRNRASNFDLSSGSLLDTSSDMISSLNEPESHFPVHTSAPTTSRRQSWNQTPDFTPTRYKERAPEQIRALEKSFFQSIFPTEDEVNRLRSETKMTRREIDSWFSEKRKKLDEKNRKAKMDYLEEDEDSIDEMILSAETETPAETSIQSTTERKVNPIKINLKDLRVTEFSDCTDMASENDNSMGIEIDNGPAPTHKVRHVKKTPQQRDILKQLFVQTQWPSNEEYDELAEQTGLPRPEIVRWFGDCRYSFKNKQLRWYERFKRNLVEYKPLSYEPLLDYYNKNHVVLHGDLEGLCEQTGLTVDEVRTWFEEKMQEELPAAPEAVDEGLYPDGGEMVENLKEIYDGFSEVSDNSEFLEPALEEPFSICLDAKQQSSIHLEAD
ncbi:hypothetical protein GDO86_013889 [Hymenochirus boettgeri]|uniref:Zinc fingers and homeoboxes protein 3 n=1 Tax=Hymenochirus boettgeri TaxID=247094 RepID=A0A8T2JS71_9PIPI|nr:hypothetical protein GDO86_013889 [Hymenochirus boettgeri]